MFSILIIQFYRNLSIVGVPHSLQLKFFLLDESNGNFEFGFFKNTQDKFNGIWPVLIILLFFIRISRDQKYYRHLVSIKWCGEYFALSRWVEVACKGLSLIQQHSKKQGQTLVSDHSQHCSGFMLNFRVYTEAGNRICKWGEGEGGGGGKHKNEYFHITDR